ncbi:hypothetical protein GCM10028818_55310 [Spirosoma horti]
MFFAKITNSHTATNRLKEYVGKQIKALDCNTVEDPEAFKKHLEGLVHRANYRFPRCKPLVSYLYLRNEQEHYAAGITEVIDFSLYKQKAVFGPQTPNLPASSTEARQATIFS